METHEVDETRDHFFRPASRIVLPCKCGAVSLAPLGNTLRSVPSIRTGSAYDKSFFAHSGMDMERILFRQFAMGDCRFSLLSPPDFRLGRNPLPSVLGQIRRWRELLNCGLPRDFAMTPK
jgi:hypothetical protein